MKVFSTFSSVIRSFDYRDKLISILSLAILLLMVVKIILLPYGLFSFGESGIYTEGLVSRMGIQNVNPLFVDFNEADREVSSLVFSGLMKYSPDKKAVVNDIAQLKINEENNEYLFTVREGIKWHDGEPLTADDVFFTYHDIIMGQGFTNEILKTNFEGVKVEKVSANQVKFTLEKPNLFFVSNFTLGIVPKHLLSETKPEEILGSDFNKKPVGSGPYMVTDPAETFNDGRMQITLTRSPNYYSDPAEVEFLRLTVFPTMDELMADVNSVNAVVKVSGSSIQDFEDNKRFSLIKYELPQYTAVFMNMESKFLKEKSVRLALQKAVDKSKMIGKSLDKIVVDTPLMELNQQQWEYQPSVEQAEGALKDAHYRYELADTEQKGPRTNDDSEPLKLNLIVRLYEEGTYQFEDTKKVVSFLQKTWEEIGVAIEVEFLPSEDLNKRITSREYDLLLVGQNLGYNLDTYSYWHSTQAGPLGQNLSNYKSFQVDSLIEDIRSTFDPEKREKKLEELASRFKDDIPAIFLYRPVYYYAYDGKVQGVSMQNVVFPSDRFDGIVKWKFF